MMTIFRIIIILTKKRIAMVVAGLLNKDGKAKKYQEIYQFFTIILNFFC